MVKFEGNWLFTGPSEVPHPDDRILRDIVQHRDTDSEPGNLGRTNSVRNYGSNKETLGTLNNGNGHTSLSQVNTTTSNYTRTETAHGFYDAIEEEQDNV